MWKHGKARLPCATQGSDSACLKRLVKRVHRKCYYPRDRANVAREARLELLDVNGVFVIDNVKLSGFP